MQCDSPEPTPLPIDHSDENRLLTSTALRCLTGDKPKKNRSASSDPYNPTPSVSSLEWSSFTSSPSDSRSPAPRRSPKPSPEPHSPDSINTDLCQSPEVQHRLGRHHRRIRLVKNGWPVEEASPPNPSKMFRVFHTLTRTSPLRRPHRPRNYNYNQGSYNQNYNQNYSQGAYYQGAYNQGAYYQGTYIQGAYNQGAYLPGAYNQGIYDQESCSQESSNQGNCNQESSNQEAYSQGNRNQDAYNQEAYPQGNCDEGTYDQGTYDQGTYNQGVYNQGVYNQGNCNQTEVNNNNNYDNNNCDNNNYDNSSLLPLPYFTLYNNNLTYRPPSPILHSCLSSKLASSSSSGDVNDIVNNSSVNNEQQNDDKVNSVEQPRQRRAVKRVRFSSQVSAFPTCHVTMITT